MIDVCDLSKRFGKTVAVDRLTFTVKPGQVTGFLGPNGAGKSTTMRIILGLDAPTAGAATIAGRAYRSLRQPLYEVGAVLEVRAVHGGRTAYNHLLCLAQSNGIGRRRVEEVLDIVGLRDVARRRVGHFSLGMSQRLGIAAALLADPPILLCDEPVNGLDPDGILWIRTLLRNLAAEGRTVFVSSHLMSEMALTADHLIVIGRGKLLADTSTADFIRTNSHNYITVRTANPLALGQLLGRAGATVHDEPDGDQPALRVAGLGGTAIGDLAAQHGIPLYELTTHQASLEAAYMQLTHDHRDFAAASEEHVQ